MGALLDEAAAVEDEDAVGVADRREAVCDDERRAARGQRPQGMQQQRLGAGVDRARRLVEDQDRRVGDVRTDEADDLALALREVGAALPDLGREPALEAVEDLRDTRATRSPRGPRPR